MEFIYIFWYKLNGLEFSTYIIIPSAIICMILLYIYFNFKILIIAWELNNDIMKHLEDENYHYKW